MTAPLAHVEVAAGTPVGNVPVLDPVVLGRLDELDPTGTNGLVRRVLMAFVTSLDRLRDQLLIGREDRDQSVVRYVAHTLKSSSGSVGATQLAQLCADTERGVREGRYADPASSGELDTRVQVLLDEIERVRLGVRQRLAA
jgi:HPt (histidine-containing phosphotransfer) domain-containing protein